MKKLLITTLCTTLLAFSTHARADDFSGPYVGGQVGYGNTNISANANVPSIGYAENFDLSATGAEAGIFAGYRFKEDKFVYGLEAEATLSRMETTYNYDDGVDELHLKAQKRYSLALGPRVGYLLTDSTLGYAGVAFTRARFKSSESVGGVSVNDDSNGLRFGGGIETVLPDSGFHIRLDHQYTRWKGWTWQDGGDSVSIKPTENVTRLGALFPF